MGSSGQICGFMMKLCGFWQGVFGQKSIVLMFFFSGGGEESAEDGGFMNLT